MDRYSNLKQSSAGIAFGMSPKSRNCAMSPSQRSRDMVPKPSRRVASVSIKGFWTSATSANDSESIVGFNWFICWLANLGSSRYARHHSRTAATIAVALSGFLRSMSPLVASTVAYGL